MKPSSAWSRWSPAGEETSAWASRMRSRCASAASMSPARRAPRARPMSAWISPYLVALFDGDAAGLLVRGRGRGGSPGRSSASRPSPDSRADTLRLQAQLACDLQPSCWRCAACAYSP